MVLIGIGTSLKQKLALKQTLYSFALKIRSGIGLFEIWMSGGAWGHGVVYFGPTLSSSGCTFAPSPSTF